MSTHTVKVQRVAIEPHPNADAIELARVGDYLSVVRKGQYQTGDLAAYLPESSLVPEQLLEELGLVGKLAGPQHNRIKAIRLRGVVSQGICLPARPHWQEGQDVAAELGVAKWEPPIPTCLQGDVWNAGGRYLVAYDIENIKAFPGVLQDGEPVVMTEKIHGTFCQIAVMPDGARIVASKGLGAKGLAFKEPGKTTYQQAANRCDVANNVRRSAAWGNLEAYIVCGEVFGAGIQDLHYGAARGVPGFRVFDVCEVGGGGTRTWLDDAALGRFCDVTGLARVPVLYRGPFSRDALAQHTTGPTTFGGVHIREGVVVRPCIERAHPDLPCGGRVQFKSVSDAYLFRGGEQTEYQ